VALRKARKFTLALFQASGRRGGKKAQANKTPAERKEAARKAAKARWAKAKPPSTGRPTPEVGLGKDPI
jgi:hypothetical protein